MYLALYVDDGLVICESQDAIDEVLLHLKSNFTLSIKQLSLLVWKLSVIVQSVH